MNQRTPTIDVIIPAYNASDFILEAIRSIENQTVRPQRILIIDDGSTDTTKEIILNHHSVCLLEYIHQENAGPNAARNTGLSRSNAEFIAFLDADDRWEPTKLEKQVALFARDTDSTLGLVYTNYKIIDGTGRDRPDIPTVPLDPEIAGYAFKRLLPGNKILGSASSVLIKKTIFHTIGFFDETLRIGEDWDMWLRITEKFQISYVNEALVAIRRHDQNQTNNILTLVAGDSAFITKWIPRISGKYPVPSIWGDRIVFNVLRGLPRLESFRIARRSLSYSIRKKLFPRTNGSLILACILFILYAVTNKEMRQRMKTRVKRYAKQ